MLGRSSSLTMALVLLCPLACKSSGDKNDDPDPDPDNGFWLVGDNGTMVQVNAEGEASGYPLETTADLLAIACHGSSTAWVAGEDGTVLHTTDAGETWDTVTLDLVADWQALAVAEHTPEGVEAVWLAGRAGAVAYTPDGGASWISVPAAEVDFTGIATEPDGNVAFAVADDGSIWQLDELGAAPIESAAMPLRAVTWAGHANVAVAVGDEGTMLRYEGDAWQAVPTLTSHDLLAVRVSSDGTKIVAVGEGGAIVRIEDGSFGALVLFDSSAPTLRGLHLGADGRGQAVGDAGTILLSSDAANTWTDLSLSSTPTLRGVDDFHLGGHL